MKHRWPKSPLGEVLYNRNELPDAIKVAIGDIPIVAKIGFNDGTISIRNDGTSNTKLISIQPNDLVISGINVEKGAIAINDTGCELAATIHYSSYYPDDKKVDLKYLWYFLRSREFSFYLKQSFPSGIKTEIKPDKFLSVEIPLPPLEEQKRIVAKLDAVRQRMEEIEKLRREQGRIYTNLHNSIFTDYYNIYPNIEIGEILVHERNPAEILPEKAYKQVTVKMDHKGVQLRKIIQGSKIRSAQFIVRKGYFIISKIDARNGAMGLIPPELDGAIVTNDFPVFSFTDRVLAKYFDYFSRTMLFDNACKAASEGSTNRRRLKMDKFYQIKMPLPNIEKQQEIVYMLDSLAEIISFQSQTIVELDSFFTALLNKMYLPASQ